MTGQDIVVCLLILIAVNLIAVFKTLLEIKEQLEIANKIKGVLND